MSLRVPIWIAASKTVENMPAKPLLQTEIGVELLAATFLHLGEAGQLTLTWHVSGSGPCSDYASLVNISDSSGQTIFRAEHAIPLGRYDALPALWTAYNDLQPAATRQPGSTWKETYSQQLERSPASREMRLSITLRQASDASWPPIGTWQVPLNSVDK